MLVGGLMARPTFLPSDLIFHSSGVTRSRNANHLRSERDVRHEMAVHDVQVQPPGAGPFRPQGFRGKLAEIRRQEGRGNDHAARLKVWQAESNLGCNGKDAS